MSSPGTPFGSLSRNLSAENLASMNALTNSDISASALHHRLANLRTNRLSQVSHLTPSEPESQHDTRLGVPHDYFGPSSGSTSHTPASPVLSRRASDEGEHEHFQHPIPSGMATPFHPHSSELETLSRVPSYDTALRSNIHLRRHDPLPDYNTVVASDVRTPTPPQSPQRAYVRDSARGSSENQCPTLEVPQRPLFQSRSPSQMDDEDRNLRVFQARA
jgi:hypothetical protein